MVFHLALFFSKKTAYGLSSCLVYFFFFFQAEDGIRDSSVTGVQTCALPISSEVQIGKIRARSRIGGNDDGSRPGVVASAEGCWKCDEARRNDRSQLREKEIGRASCRERV